MLKPWSDSIPPTHSTTKIPAADPPERAPVAAPRRRSRQLAEPGFAPINPLSEQAFPSWRVRRQQAMSAPEAAATRLFRRRRPRFVRPNSSRRSAVRRGAAAAPGARRRHRLRRSGAPSRGFFRAARRRASRARLRRKQPRRANPSAVARFRPAVLAARCADAANRADFWTSRPT